jgi:hypothetical protein
MITTICGTASPAAQGEGLNKGSVVSPKLLTCILWLATAPLRCDDPHPPAAKPDPKPGDPVKLRGTLGEDVDCRIFHSEAGKTYSLDNNLRGYPNGTRLCIYGTVAEASQCLTTPMLDVQTVKAWASCP